MPTPADPDFPALPVLVDENVWPEFQDAIRSLGPRWQAASRRTYRLDLEGRHLVVNLLREGIDVLPARDDVDDDLLELAAAVQDAVGEPWSGEGLRKAAVAYGWHGRPGA